MSIIKGRILPSNFELVRDRIALILAAELANQATKYGDTDLNVKVWNSRFIPFDKTETITITAVNVNLFRSDFVQYDVEDNTAIHKYAIDVYAAAKSTVAGVMGDGRSMQRMEKVIGVCRAILKDAQYRTLAFTPPSIWTTFPESIEIANPFVQQQDADSQSMGRLLFNVKINEEIDLLVADGILGYDTQVKIELTDKGYYYKVNNYA